MHTIQSPYAQDYVYAHQCVCVCPAGAAKGYAFFKRSTFDVSKVDDAFCLQARVPDENDTDMVESSDTADVSKENTQVIFLGEADFFSEEVGHVQRMQVGSDGVLLSNVLLPTHILCMCASHSASPLSLQRCPQFPWEDFPSTRLSTTKWKMRTCR